MVHFAISRVLWLIPTLLAMALVTFLVMHATPGSPLDPVAEGANPLSPEAQQNLARHYGLDRPLYEQFGIFVANAVRGDFGNSFVYRTRSVREILVDTFPVSLLLGSMALALAIVAYFTLDARAAFPAQELITVISRPSFWEGRVNVSGVILAAGASTRLGRPKQLLPFDGEPAIHVVARNALASRLAEVVVVTGGSAEAVGAAIADYLRHAADCQQQMRISPRESACGGVPKSVRGCFNGQTRAGAGRD